MSDPRTGRRQFFRMAAGATIGLSALSYGKVLGANQRIILGIIGSGGRGRNLMNSFLKVGKEELEFAGVCDVYEHSMAEGMKLAGNRAKNHDDHKELLARKEINAVIVGTPDHWHHDQLMDSLAAGKDVYLEKPMSWSLEQGAAMVKAVRASKQIVQVGMQRRSSPVVHQAKKLVDEGVLGDVNLVRAQWFWNMEPLAKKRELRGKLDWDRFCGPAKKQPLTHGDHENVAFLNWRYFWAFSGGNMTDQGTHLMDVIQWFMNDGKPPRSAVCSGQVHRLQPSETPDTYCAVFEYPKFLATWTLAYTNSYQDSWRITFQGNKASMELDDQGCRVLSDPGRGRRKPQEQLHEIKGSLPTDPHVENFLQCMRTRKEPNAPVEVGHFAVAGPHLANLALKKGDRMYLKEDGTPSKGP